ncbi:sigma-70 family RNA polymerase sigma factor [Gaopeijia maritima]|uniref:Sigma-70 family RNA polymerase sigma factor n=1 Tax=Gaopeijia maritima TaxID=3119007 RepID=A0ABU9E4E7_9BACT
MTTVPITRLLDRAGEGDAEAWNAVFDGVYDELRLLARRQRGRWTGHATLDTTALVHEAWLKLARPDELSLRDRGHFFALASRVMRQILCNYARDRAAQKRGGGRERVTLDEGVVGGDSGPAAAVALRDLDDALTRLEQSHARVARVVECRFFGGLTVQETADALGVSPRTVKREWRFAQAWLQGELAGGEHDG